MLAISMGICWETSAESSRLDLWSHHALFFAWAKVKFCTPQKGPQKWIDPLNSSFYRIFISIIREMHDFNIMYVEELRKSVASSCINPTSETHRFTVASLWFTCAILCPHLVWKPIGFSWYLVLLDLLVQDDKTTSSSHWKCMNMS